MFVTLRISRVTTICFFFLGTSTNICSESSEEIPKATKQESSETKEAS